jgi:hypothetical protein
MTPFDPDRFLDPPDDEPGICAECGEDAEDCACEGGADWMSLREYNEGRAADAAYDGRDD